MKYNILKLHSFLAASYTRNHFIMKMVPPKIVPFGG